ncbi:uncharacterized protein [Palaemon carinicauda]|uniref:uncharacterized protein n=1 Tax=Palaemon carinicauda TaxID=392227 RepID=UPI0035B63102
MQAVIVQIDIGRKYTICSLYLPPNDIISYNNLVEAIQQLPQPFILLGELNGKHPLGGDVLANTRSNISLFVENENVGLPNTGKPRHFHVWTGILSCSDLSIASSNYLLDFDWRTLDEWHTSDHAPIIIKSNNDSPLEKSPRWKLDKVYWNSFWEPSQIEGSAEHFESVDDAIDLLNGH